MKYTFEKSCFFFFNKAQLQEIEYVLSVRLPWEVLLGVASFALTVDLTVVVGFCQLGTNLDTCRKRVPELGKQASSDCLLASL